MGEVGVVLDLADRIAGAPTPALLVVALIGFLLGWWVPGWVYRQALGREKEWKQRALSGTELAEKAGDRLVAGRRRRPAKREE